MAEINNKNEDEMEEKRMRLTWGSTDDLTALYANHLYVSHGGETEFHLVFGHLTPPLIIGISEDELPSKIEIKPLANIVVSYEVMKRFVQAMNENLEKFEQKMENR